MIVERLISIALQGKSIPQLTSEVLNLMTGSVELSGAGGILGGTHRDLDLEGTSQELDNFLELLTTKGYSYVSQ